MHRFVTLACILISLLSPLGGSSGLEASTGAEFLRLEVPASSGALAAGAADSGGSENLIRNPAGILGRSAPALAFTHFSAFGDFNYEQLEGVLPGWLGGTWAARFFYAGSQNLVELDNLGQEAGEVAYHDILLQVAYALPLGAGFEAGLALKGFESQLSSYSSMGGAADAGVRYQTPWAPLAVGISLQNLGARSAFISEADPLPTQLTGGLALAFAPATDHRLKVLADYRQVLVNGEPGLLSLGLDYQLFRAAHLRGGYRLENELGQLSLGAGVRLSGLGLDYAFQPLSELGTSHRVTLSYAFLSADPEPVPAPTPRPTPVVKMRELTVLPRSYESSIVFKTPRVNPNVRDWDFEIRDYTGRLVKFVSGVGPPPRYFKWDGRNQAGELLPQKDRYQFVFKTEKQTVVKHELPAFHPVLKFRFVDGSELEPEVRFRIKTRPEVKKWNLEIMRGKSRKSIQTITAEGQLPAEIIWDGKDSRGKVADSRLIYHYILTVTYPDNSKLGVSEKIRPVSALEVTAPAGRDGILIPQILFDFDSAALKPEMMDKIMAAVGVVQKYGSKAKVICEGHADDVGSRQYNRQLSLVRSQMVKRFMTLQPRVSKKRISARGFGTKQPENRKDSEAGRARNRRVEIRLFFPESGDKSKGK